MECNEKLRKNVSNFGEIRFVVALSNSTITLAGTVMLLVGLICS